MLVYCVRYAPDVINKFGRRFLISAFLVGASSHSEQACRWKHLYFIIMCPTQLEFASLVFCSPERLRRFSASSSHSVLPWNRKVARQIMMLVPSSRSKIAPSRSTPPLLCIKVALIGVPACGWMQNEANLNHSGIAVVLTNNGDAIYLPMVF